MPLARFENLAEPRRAAILDAALEEFAARGFEGASFNKILERAGVSKGAIYYYFADKEDLYLTVLERAVAELVKDVPPLPGAGDAEGFWRDVARLYAAMVANVRRDPRVVRLAQRSAADLLRLTQTARFAPMMIAARTSIVNVLETGVAVGAVRDDLPFDLLLELTFAVGQLIDRFSLESGELATEAGCARSVERGVDLLRRLLEPRPAQRNAKPASPGRKRGASRSK